MHECQADSKTPESPPKREVQQLPRETRYPGLAELSDGGIVGVKLSCAAAFSGILAFYTMKPLGIP